MKVLIVEPDWRFGKMASKYLESHAHHVVQESRLDDALARTAHWRPDLVIVAAELAEDGSWAFCKTRPRAIARPCCSRAGSTATT